MSAAQFLLLAAAEKISALLTEKYLEEEAQKGRREDFEKVMQAVPSVEPEERDCQTGLCDGVMGPQLETVIHIWPSIKNIFSIPHSEEEYDQLVTLLDSLIDEVRENEEHPLASLMETIGSLVEAYENEHLPEFGGSAAGVLSYLMEEHTLRPSDLPELGDQDVVAELMEGNRFLDTRQIKALSARFHVSPLVVIQE
jgi:HTH-type transcriptional regulator/antitoxin HigA